MLKSTLLHPDILYALASNGHGSKILIADSNFPVSTQTPITCKKVFLNLAPGVLSVTDVLKVIHPYLPTESAKVMATPAGIDEPIHRVYNEILGDKIVLERLSRQEFYKQTSSFETCLAISTGDTRRFANILIIMGVHLPK
ncbi:MAG: RbsD/FucU family protein [Puia sp.]